jgi:hypothetical protein
VVIDPKTGAGNVVAATLVDNEADGPPKPAGPDPDIPLGNEAAPKVPNRLPVAVVPVVDVVDPPNAVAV